MAKLHGYLTALGHKLLKLSKLLVGGQETSPDTQVYCEDTEYAALMRTDYLIGESAAPLQRAVQGGGEIMYSPFPFPAQRQL